MRKPLLLFLALLLPASVFLFLHYFGKNEFEVPVFYQTPIDVPSACAMEYEFPYKLKSDKVKLDGITVVLFFSGLSNEALNESVFQLNRLSEEFGEATPKIILIRKTDDQTYPGNDEILLSIEDYVTEQQCIFLAASMRIVLVDDEKQIRGLYEDASLKEIDRLILELKIIFKQY